MINIRVCKCVLFGFTPTDCCVMRFRGSRTCISWDDIAHLTCLFCSNRVVCSKGIAHSVRCAARGHCENIKYWAECGPICVSWHLFCTWHYLLFFLKSHHRTLHNWLHTHTRTRICINRHRGLRLHFCVSIQTDCQAKLNCQRINLWRAVSAFHGKRLSRAVFAQCMAKRKAHLAHCAGIRWTFAGWKPIHLVTAHTNGSHFVGFCFVMVIFQSQHRVCDTYLSVWEILFENELKCYYFAVAFFLGRQLDAFECNVIYKSYIQNMTSSNSNQSDAATTRWWWVTHIHTLAHKFTSFA